MCESRLTLAPNQTGNLFVLVILLVVLLAALVHKLFPLFAMFTGGVDQNILPVVQVVKGVPCLSSDSIGVAFSLKYQQMLWRPYTLLVDYFQAFILNNDCHIQNVSRNKRRYVQSSIEVVLSKCAEGLVQDDFPKTEEMIYRIRGDSFHRTLTP